MERFNGTSPIAQLSLAHISEYNHKIGKEGLALVTTEECSELIKAVTKIRRAELTQDTIPKKQKADLAEELAHVYMCMQCVQHAYQIPTTDINREIHKSMERYQNGHILQVEDKTKTE